MAPAPGGREHSLRLLHQPYDCGGGGGLCSGLALDKFGTGDRSSRGRNSIPLCRPTMRGSR